MDLGKTMGARDLSEAGENLCRSAELDFLCVV